MADRPGVNPFVGDGVVLAGQGVAVRMRGERARQRVVARAGLVRLGEAQHAAYDAAGGGAAGFNATGAAYVRFALAHPALFRLIFAQPDGDAMKGEGNDDAMTFLLANATALAPDGTGTRVLALGAWSLAHGLAMLMLDDAVPADDALIAGVVDVRALRQ